MRLLLTSVLLGASFVPALAAPPAALREAAPLPQQPPGQIEVVAPVTTASQGPIAVGVDADVYCSGYLDRLDQVLPGSVVGAENQDIQTIFFQGDILYIDIGTKRGAVAGQEFWVVRPGQEIADPYDETITLGRIWETPARVRIICALEDNSIAEIVQSCDVSVLGDLLAPFEPIPIPLVRRTRSLTSCDPPTGKLLGRIVGVFDRATPIAQESIVYLDRGELDGLTPGDFLTVFRKHVGSGVVRTLLGEVAVLTTRDRTSVGKVVAMRDVMGVGDEVELK